MPNAVPALRLLPTQHAASVGLRRRAKAAHGSAGLFARQSYSVVTCPSAARHRRRSSGFPPHVRHAKTARRRSAPPSPGVVGAPAAKCPLRLASARSGGKNAGVRTSPNALFQAHAAGPRSHGAQAVQGMRQHAVPNPSFKPSPNGGPRWPASAGPSAHFALAGQRVPPSVPA